MLQPNFLIVGAPKCGTTAMWRYLDAHPDIWLCPRKDMHYFGHDLTFTKRERFSKQQYMDFFANAQGQAIGEASVWYLFSTHAAPEIKQFDPNMRIIIMLRNPVHMIYAHYTQMRFNGLGDEDQATFELALAKEQARSEGRDLPQDTPLPQALLYRQIGCFAQQLQRYFDCFPREQIHVIVQEEMKQDTATCYRQCLEFLAVDPGFVPSFARVNSHKVVRSEALRRLIKRIPQPIKDAVPNAPRRVISRQLRKVNSKHAKRTPLSPETQRSLQEFFQADIEKVETLLEKDLSVWKTNA